MKKSITLIVFKRKTLYFILMTAYEGNICFVSSIEIRGKQNRCFPRKQSLSVMLYSINKKKHIY